MNTRLYWKNRIPFFLLNVLCMLALSFFLFATGSSPDTVLFIVLVWLLLLLLCTAVSCHLRRKELDRLLHITEQLKRRCLIADVMKQPPRAEDQVYRQILRLSEKSMLEEIAGIERERTAYREYIEQWIHEIKTPITAMRLLCENNRTPFTKELLAQLEKTDRYTEQALYYARSEHTEKDFVVREITLCDVIHQAVTDNKYLLMQNHMTVDVEESGLTVFADEKWLRFILNQLIANAVKYRLDDSVQSASPRSASIWSAGTAPCVCLCRITASAFPPATCPASSTKASPDKTAAADRVPPGLACICADVFATSWRSAWKPIPPQ